MTTSRWILPRMRNVSDNSCREDRNTFYVQQILPENRAIYEIMWKNIWWSQTGRSDNTARAHCLLGNSGYRHIKYVIFIAFPLQQCSMNAPQCYVIRTLPALLCVSVCRKVFGSCAANLNIWKAPDVWSHTSRIIVALYVLINKVKSLYSKSLCFFFSFPPKSDP